MKNRQGSASPVRVTSLRSSQGVIVGDTTVTPYSHRHDTQIGFVGFFSSRAVQTQKEFMIDGIIDCGRTSGARRDIGTTIGVLTDHITGTSSGLWLVCLVASRARSL